MESSSKLLKKYWIFTIVYKTLSWACKFRRHLSLGVDIFQASIFRECPHVSTFFTFCGKSLQCIYKWLKMAEIGRKLLEMAGMIGNVLELLDWLEKTGSGQTWKKPFFCELLTFGIQIWWTKTPVNYNKFEIATKQRRSNI